MVYFVSGQYSLYASDAYEDLPLERALEILNSWDIVQYDSETTGRDPHLCKPILIQFGNDKDDIRIVVDVTTIDIMLFKDILESKLIVGQNLKFDLQFLYNYGIKPLKVYDTMIVEQLLHLGYDRETFRVSLQAIALRRLGIDIDKSIRGQIIWRGIDEAVIKYAAMDVVYLEKIKEQQELELERTKCRSGALLENQFVPVIAYLEWCGIKLDEDAWHKYMKVNQDAVVSCEKELNQWVVDHIDKYPKLNQYIYINRQGDLFNGYDLTPKCNLKWSSAKQLIPFFKILGFDVKTTDKKTGQNKESVQEKLIAKQKGVCDDFLKIYFKYQEARRAASTYGDTYLNAVNPITGRIHSIFRQLGCDSGRMSCGGGSTQHNDDLAKYKHISPSKCLYVQLQNLPANKEVRSSFVPNKGNLMVSCDYGALESRLGADIYNEESMINEYLHGSGDIHSLTAKHCFPKELAGIEVKDIADKRPDLRKKAKPVEFSQQFGGSANAIQNALGCSKLEAQEIAKAYNEGFKGIAEFKQKGKLFVQTYGFILINPKTGHKLWWQNFNKWKELETLNDFEKLSKYTSKEIQELNIEASKYVRLSLNAPTQGTGSIILKYAMILFFKWIVRHDYFGKVLICNLVHDEAVVEFPEELKDIVPDTLKKYMEYSGSKFCEKLPIPAVPAVGDHWIH